MLDKEETGFYEVFIYLSKDRYECGNPAPCRVSVKFSDNNRKLTIESICSYRTVSAVEEFRLSIVFSVGVGEEIDLVSTYGKCEIINGTNLFNRVRIEKFKYSNQIWKIFPDSESVCLYDQVILDHVPDENDDWLVSRGPDLQISKYNDQIHIYIDKKNTSLDDSKDN